MNHIGIEPSIGLKSLGIERDNHLSLGFDNERMHEGLTLALSGTQQAPQSGILLLSVRDEQPVNPGQLLPHSFCESLLTPLLTQTLSIVQ
ncbi:hypothetical protein [Rhodoferax saidenbachensis]|uniref:Uncharacterized protein n=1 Tax=Rhodoferax saidenbachensis TaxID=1484693 RepID=A0ABU1ZLB1_9BURK|nr:hypothetical protein [Rhodoferax saidenbachensis]MDR7306329.1 hypothetical protein [Rhodoferax saidenbachensis]